MALPGSGNPLSFSQINVELGNGSTAQASMATMTAAAIGDSGITATPDAVSEWYGYSHASAPPAPVKCNIIEGPITFTGSWYHPDTTETGFRCEYKINTGSWTFWGNAAAGASNYSNQIPGCSIFDSIYFRVRAYNGAGNSAYCEDLTPVTTQGFGCN